LNAPECSVVIPTYNGRRLLATCIDSVVRHASAGTVIEIIVVDDASTDGTPEWLASEFPQCRLVRLEHNLGFCGAANAGIAAAKAPVIQLLNNDTEVTAGWIEAGLAPFADPRVGSVAPLVFVRSDPSRVDSAGDRYAFFGWPSKRGHGEPAAKWAAHKDDFVFGASGSSAFYRTEALRRVGAYDPAFGSYYEDVDLAFRLRWGGYVCAYAPKCRILHEVSASYKHARPELQRRMSRNLEILFWSNLPLGWLALAAAPHVGFCFVQALWRFAGGRLRPFLEGKYDALLATPSYRARRADRVALAREARNRPHFPISVVSLADVRNHITRADRADAK
jgi:GT2 family glycosyltransferase